MSKNALIKLLNTVLISAVCFTPVMAKPVNSIQIQKLTQTVAVGVLKKLDMLDKAKPELEIMSLEKVVSEAYTPVSLSKRFVKQSVLRWKS